jgi:two-component SAPR family response regulator
MGQGAGATTKDHRAGALDLVWLVLGLALGGAALYALGGPPRWPTELPRWDVVMGVLHGADVPLELMAYLLVTAAWALWLWLVASVALRILVLAADDATRGATWVGSLRAVSDRVTLPLVRRLVDGAVVAALVVHLLGRGASSAAAAPLGAIATVAPARDLDHGAAPPAAVAENPGDDQESVEYTVQQDDTLWAIAERFYGTGFEYPRLVPANVGRVMADGRRFTRAGVIQPGWQLTVPRPSRAVETIEGAPHYVVDEGDTLRGIAARLLDDESRWPEIFQLNAGTARLGDGRTFSDPDLIWPGLRLRLPLTTPPTDPAVSPTDDADPPYSPSVPEPDALPTAAEPPPQPIPQPDPPSTVAAPTEPDGAASSTTDGALIPIALGAAGAAAVAGGAALILRRRVRRSLREPPVHARPTSAARAGGFAEVELARPFSRRLHGDAVEPAQLVAEQSLRFCRERGIAGASVIAAVQGRNWVALTLSVSLAEQRQLVEVAGEFGPCLGASSQAEWTVDHDVLLRVSGLKTTALTSALPSPLEAPPRLVPIGVLAGRDTLYANWRALGHILIVGLPGGGVETVLASLLAALAARCRPDELRLLTIANPRLLPAQLASLPHQHGPVIDPADSARVRAALDELRAELTRRVRGTEHDPAEAGTRDPDLALVVGELADLDAGDTTLEIMGTDGPGHGVQLLAATSRPEALGPELLTHFDTRLVLQTLDEHQSVQVLGRSDAARLGPGELLVRLAGRSPIHTRGLRLDVDHLDQLVRLMIEVYGGRSGRARDTVSSGESAAPATTDSDQADDAPLPLLSEHALRVQNAGWTRAASERPEARTPDELHENAHSVAGGVSTTVAVPPESVGVQAPRAASAVKAGDQPLEEPQTHAAVIEAGAATVAEPRFAVSVAASSETAVQEVESRASGPAIQVRCFGALVVRSGSREITPSDNKSARHKAWEVLAFLATQPGGAAPKEKLLAALWPSTGTEQATNRMRVAMARLRTVLAQQIPGLPGEVVRTDRDGTCRLDVTRVASDAQEFRMLYRSARKLPPDEAQAVYERALALYRGDLLADRSYRWIDERAESGLSPREAYREEYYQALQQLARLHQRAGRAQLAVPLYKRLLKAEPTLEDIVRELYRCYQQLGDVGSLVREERQLRQALQQAYRDPDDPAEDPELYQPEPETTAVFHEILAALQAKTTADPRKG